MTPTSAVSLACRGWTLCAESVSALELADDNAPVRLLSCTNLPLASHNLVHALVVGLDGAQVARSRSDDGSQGVDRRLDEVVQIPAGVGRPASGKDKVELDGDAPLEDWAAGHRLVGS